MHQLKRLEVAGGFNDCVVDLIVAISCAITIRWRSVGETIVVNVLVVIKYKR